jgi:ABC-type sugar transport system substrate-binding protein
MAPERQRWASLVVLALLVAVPASCRRRQPPPSRPRIALVMKSLANEFFLTMEVVIMAVLGTGRAQVGAQDPAKRLITGCVIVAAAVTDRYRHRVEAQA